MFNKYFFKRRFIKTLQDEIWTENINAKFAKSAYDDLVRIQEKDVNELEELQLQLESLNSIEKPTEKKERDDLKVKIAKVKGQIAVVEKKIDTREDLLTRLNTGIIDKHEKIKTYENKINFVKKNG